MNSNEWFTEQAASTGTAFSLKINKKLHEEQSDFQHLEIYETETFGNLMIIDGCTMVSTRDNFFYHEMMSHPALFLHPNPKRVWIIGGGDCGQSRSSLSLAIGRYRRAGRRDGQRVGAAGLRPGVRGRRARRARRGRGGAAPPRAGAHRERDDRPAGARPRAVHRGQGARRGVGR